VIYASGDIVSGTEENNYIPSEIFAKAVRKAREDKNVKAIVLRINSPGGEMIAADVILRELKLAAKEKPIVSSFGDYAASGGYYIACASSYIIAQPTTLTGSIGVFSVIPNIQNTLKNKLGITIDGVKTNDNAEYISMVRPMTAFQKAVMLRETESAYGTFIGYVAENRKMSTAAVDSIGQGRVWCGTEAIKIGLVDELGNINRAVAKAAELAKLKNYKLISLPSQKDPMTKLMESLSGDKQEEAMLKSHLGELYSYYEYIRKSDGHIGVQARMPWVVELR
jgi:protease-4